MQLESDLNFHYQITEVTTFGCSQAMSDTLEVDPEAGEPVGRMRQRRVTTTSFQDVSLDYIFARLLPGAGAMGSGFARH